jgi:hypothetical protein
MAGIVKARQRVRGLDRADRCCASLHRGLGPGGLDHLGCCPAGCPTPGGRHADPHGDDHTDADVYPYADADPYAYCHANRDPNAYADGHGHADPDPDLDGDTDTRLCHRPLVAIAAYRPRGRG